MARNSENATAKRLKSCPVCGKTPRVKYSAILGSGFYVKILCKPLLRQRHLTVWCGAATEERAFFKAVEAWNKKVMEVENNDGC